MGKRVGVEEANFGKRKVLDVCVCVCGGGGGVDTR